MANQPPGLGRKMEYEAARPFDSYYDMDLAPDVLAASVIDGAVLGELPTQRRIDGAFVGHKVRLAAGGFGNDRAQVL